MQILLTTVNVQNLPNTSWNDPAIIVQVINLFVMGLFTFFVWRATKASAKAAQDSVEVAKDSLRHSVEIFEMKKDELEFLNSRYKQDIERLMIKFISNILGQTTGPKTELIEEIKKISKPENEVLIKIFNKEEMQLVDHFFIIVGSYLRDYWNGSFNPILEKEIFRVETYKTVDKLTDIYHELY